MYLPIPQGVSVSQTVTAYAPATECDSAGQVSRTASFSVPKSTVALMKKANSSLEEHTKPLDGSWREIRDSGSIKMTPMSHKKETHTYYVAGVQVPYQKWSTAIAGRDSKKVNGVCKPCMQLLHHEVKLAIVKGRYVEQGDLDYWKAKYPHAPHFRRLPYLDYNQIEKKKGEAYAELFQAYNLGEEVVELRETIGGITKLSLEAVRLITKFKPMITGLLKRGLHKEAASRWMEFRYGIMPIYYSIQDIIALKRETGLYRTIRKGVKPKDDEALETNELIYFEDVGVSTVRCSVTAKGRWGSQELKMLDLINVNPFTTALEVYPWAMVVRWFINVSDFAVARVKSLTSLALETVACVAIKEKMEYGTYLSHTQGYVVHPYEPGGYCNGLYPPTYFGTYEDIVTSYVNLGWHSVDNYNRYLFLPSDVDLVYAPYMDWRRGIDALILGSGQLSKLLRSLK